MIILAAPFVWKSDSFQKMVFPADYWQKQVDDIEKSIAINEHLIRSTYREMKKIQLTASIDVAEAVDSAITVGAPQDLAKEQAVGEIEHRIKEHSLVIQKISDDNARLKEDLEKAKAELAKYK